VPVGRHAASPTTSSPDARSAERIKIHDGSARGPVQSGILGR